MRILLTNDDGVQSQGLTLLHKRLQDEHEVWLIAPEHEMSGFFKKSHQGKAESRA